MHDDIFVLYGVDVFTLKSKTLGNLHFKRARYC